MLQTCCLEIYNFLLLVNKFLNSMCSVYLVDLLTYYKPKRDGLLRDRAFEHQVT